MTTNVIEIHELSRQFGHVKALNGLSGEVHEGEVFGLLGPNGAGKTTSVRLLNGVLAPSGGWVRVLGLDPLSQGTDVRRRTGVLTETPSLYERLTARDNLAIFGKLYGVREPKLTARVNELLGLFGLQDRAEDRAGGFSKGMKQRLALARALLHEPEVLFLDEPTSGLDPEAARQVMQLIAQLSRRQGRTVFLCTHNLDEAQRLCDRVAVMHKGSLLAAGTLDELAHTLWRETWVDIVLCEALTEQQVVALRALHEVSDVQLDAEKLAVKVSAADSVPKLITALAGAGAQMMSVNPRQHTLEEVYFELQEQQK
jgi:ABC-2 type transport system ATP-binding protein